MRRSEISKEDTHIHKEELGVAHFHSLLNFQFFLYFNIVLLPVAYTSSYFNLTGKIESKILFRIGDIKVQ